MAAPQSFLWTRRVILTFLAAFALLPVYVMVSSSLKPLQDVSGKFHWIPSGLTVQPYFDIWDTVPLARYFVNSLVVAGSATVLSVIIAVFSAYAVSRYKFAASASSPSRSSPPRCSPASSSCSRCS